MLLLGAMIVAGCRAPVGDKTKTTDDAVRPRPVPGISAPVPVLKSMQAAIAPQPPKTNACFQLWLDQVDPSVDGHRFYDARTGKLVVDIPAANNVTLGGFVAGTPGEFYATSYRIRYTDQGVRLEESLPSNIARGEAAAVPTVPVNRLLHTLTVTWTNSNAVTLQRSTNLRQWTNVASISTKGVVTRVVTNEPVMFYRVTGAPVRLRIAPHEDAVSSAGQLQRRVWQHLNAEIYADAVPGLYPAGEVWRALRP